MTEFVGRLNSNKSSACAKMSNWLTSSVVLAALLTALAALQTNERRIKIENVTAERARWRAEVRRKALAVHRAAMEGNGERISELLLEFTLILNPFDPKDLEILATPVDG